MTRSSQPSDVERARRQLDACDLIGAVVLRRLGLVDDSYIDAVFHYREDDLRVSIEDAADAILAAYRITPEQADRDTNGSEFWRLFHHNYK